MVLLLAATAGAYVVARAIESAGETGRKRVLMFAAVTALTCFIALFKSAFWLRPFLHRELVMPLGISYFTFKLISYVVDVYWGKMPGRAKLHLLRRIRLVFPANCGRAHSAR